MYANPDWQSLKQLIQVPSTHHVEQAVHFVDNTVLLWLEEFKNEIEKKRLNTSVT